MNRCETDCKFIYCPVHRFQFLFIIAVIVGAIIWFGEQSGDSGTEPAETSTSNILNLYTGCKIYESDVKSIDNSKIFTDITGVNADKLKEFNINDLNKKFIVGYKYVQISKIECRHELYILENKAKQWDLVSKIVQSSDDDFSKGCSGSFYDHIFDDWKIIKHDKSFYFYFSKFYQMNGTMNQNYAYIHFYLFDIYKKETNIAHFNGTHEGSYQELPILNGDFFHLDSFYEDNACLLEYIYHRASFNNNISKKSSTNSHINKWFVSNDDIHRKVFMFDKKKINIKPLLFENTEFLNELLPGEKFSPKKVLSGNRYDIYTTYTDIVYAFDKKKGVYKIFWIPPLHPAGSYSSIEYKFKSVSDNIIEFKNDYETFSYDLSNDILYMIEQDSRLYDEANFDVFTIKGGRLTVF